MQTLASFKVRTNGSITVKPSLNAIGTIQYYFKAKQMNAENARIVSIINESHIIVVTLNEPTKKHSFVKTGNKWLMEAHLFSNSLLNGTEFILNEKS